VNKPVLFDGHVTGADVFPAVQILAVVDLLPLIGVAGASVVLGSEWSQAERE
jgi:hypothetical protein